MRGSAPCNARKSLWSSRYALISLEGITLLRSEPISRDEVVAGSPMDDAGGCETTSVWKAVGEGDKVDADFA